MSKDKSWWGAIRSMKIGLYLVLAIIIASILGTIVPGQQSNGSQGWLSAFLQLNDVYHSWWYIGLLGMLTLNLAACSFYRLKTLHLKPGRSFQLLDIEQLTRLKVHTSLTVTGELKEASSRIGRLLSQRGYRVWSDCQEGCCRMGAQYGLLGEWGSLVIHLSFLVIISGLLIGALGGHQGSINAPVGTTFSVSSVPGIGSKALKNDFQVRVEGFWIERYPDGTPSGYYSRLSILKDNQAVQTSTIGVNEPLKYEGTKFYQARYGNTVEIQVNGPGAKTVYRGFVIEGDNFIIPGTNLSILARTDYKGSSSQTAGSAAPGRIIYAIFENNQRVGMGSAEPGSMISPGQDEISIQFVRAVPYTGLLVKRDPGIPLVWLGAGFMLAGLSLTFFLLPRRLWIVVEQQDGLLNAIMGGKSSRNPGRLEERIKDLAAAIQEDAILAHGEHGQNKEVEQKHG